eukprot:s877_g4.t1
MQTALSVVSFCYRPIAGEGALSTLSITNPRERFCPSSNARLVFARLDPDASLALAPNAAAFSLKLRSFVKSGACAQSQQKAMQMPTLIRWFACFLVVALAQNLKGSVDVVSAVTDLGDVIVTDNQDDSAAPTELHHDEAESKLHAPTTAQALMAFVLVFVIPTVGLVAACPDQARSSHEEGQGQRLGGSLRLHLLPHHARLGLHCRHRPVLLMGRTVLLSGTVRSAALTL